VTPTLFSLLGFQGLVIDRINIFTQQNMQADPRGGLEFVWRPAAAEFGASMDVITHDLNEYK